VSIVFKCEKFDSKMLKEAKDELSSTCAKIATIGRDLKIWRAAVKEVPTALLQDLTQSTKILQTIATNSGIKDLITSVQALNQCVQQIIKSFQTETINTQFENLIRDLVSTLMLIKSHTSS